MLSLLVVSALALTFNVQPVRASGTVYIRADGSIDPPTAPITTVDNITYTLTGNITSDADGIVIERDNMMLDGASYTVQGAGAGTGFYLSNRFNVTIRNVIVREFEDGIYLSNSQNNTISGNIVTANHHDGILLEYSSFNSIANNNSSANGDGSVGPDQDGIELRHCHHNNVVNNDFIANIYDDGIELWDSTFNNVVGNHIVGNVYGVWDSYSNTNNKIYHNCLIGNTNNARIGANVYDIWDDGYPSGGNYWSDYNSSDLFSGSHQNETGSDGIGDSPYIIDANNRDNYPLMNPWVPYENGTIYIRADGSVDPSGAPILRKGDLYTLTSNITSNADGIVIERDNMTLDGAGYTVQGTGSENGISLAGRSNVTIKDMTIREFSTGVYSTSSDNNTFSGNNIATRDHGIILDSSSGNNSISGNNITANYRYGIWLYSSSNNSVSGNNITASYGYGIWLYSSSNNSVSGNNITANHLAGICLDSSSGNNSISGNNIANNYDGIILDSSSGNNSISGNNITANNEVGIALASSSGNSIFHNNFANNAQQVYSSSTDVWDDGYPSGGNYWSDYTGVDLHSGPYQNETGSDGIGDTPYVIDSSNMDNFPLMSPYPSHDVAVAGVVAAPTYVCQGYGCLLEVSLASKGDYAERFNVTVYANMTDTGNATVIHTFENVTLNSRDSTTLSFMWDTTGFDLGEYTIGAYATPVQGEINTADNTLVDGTVEIIPGMTGGGGGRMPYMD
jgi:parallel beta-helix repeat protein